MNWLKWKPGRQGTGYFKMKLLESKFFKFDIYLIKFPEGSLISWHTDPVVRGYRHHRLNLVLKRAEVGGSTLFRDDAIATDSNDLLIKFRPDIHEHRVTRIHKGSKWILSIGWLKKDG